MIEVAKAVGFYRVQCYRAGRLVWEDSFPNQVVTVGTTDMLEKYFRGAAYTAGWFLGLVEGPGSGNTYSPADTMVSHAGWVESSAYTQATRPAAAFDPAAGGILQTSAPAVFNINSPALLAGGFLTTSSVKGGTAGILYSVGNFIQGDRGVVAGDEIRLSYETQLTV